MCLDRYKNISVLDMENDIYKNLGLTVRGLRTTLGWSQEELGERAGFHASYIGQIERGTKKISLLAVQRLAAALKVKIADLLAEKPLKYAPSTWETRIIGMIKDRPASQQMQTYRIIKETLRPFPKSRK